MLPVHNHLLLAAPAVHERYIKHVDRPPPRYVSLSTKQHASTKTAHKTNIRYHGNLMSEITNNTPKPQNRNIPGTVRRTHEGFVCRSPPLLNTFVFSRKPSPRAGAGAGAVKIKKCDSCSLKPDFLMCCFHT